MIPLKTPEEIEVMAEGGRLLARVMEETKKKIAPGVRTKELNDEAARLIREGGAEVAFRGYQGFPEDICVAVNEEVVHGVPSQRRLKEGDIVTLDMGLVFEGWYLDMARTFPVGRVSPEARHLVETAKKALRLGVKKARPGSTAGDIGNTVQRFAESQGYGVVRELCGHGIGRELHEEPKVLNYGGRRTGEELKAGMVLCIEPMITQGDWDVALAGDQQTYLTKDGSLAAHEEDTVAVTSEGPLVLTRA